MIKGPKKNVNVILPLELYDTLNALAQESHRTIPGYIRQVLKHYLRHRNDCPDPIKDWWVVK